MTCAPLTSTAHELLNSVESTLSRRHRGHTLIGGIREATLLQPAHHVSVEGMANSIVANIVAPIRVQPLDHLEAIQSQRHFIGGRAVQTGPLTIRQRSAAGASGRATGAQTALVAMELACFSSRIARELSLERFHRKSEKQNRSYAG